MRLDGFAILRAVARHAELFSEARAAIDKAALAILTAQLKARTFDLDRLKRTRKAVGAETLALILKQLPGSVPKSLMARIDPHHPKPATARRARSRVMALAGGVATQQDLQQERPGAGAGTKQARSAKGRNEGGKKRASKGRKAPRPQEDGIAKGFWATSVMAKPQRLAGRR